MNPRTLLFPLLLALAGSHVAAAAENSALPEPLGSAIDYLTVADVAVQLKDWKKAEEILRDGMAAHPRSDGFHLSLGYVLENQGETADAFYEYQWETVRAANPRLSQEAARRSAALLNGKTAGADEARSVIAALQLAEKNPAAARKALAAVSHARGDRFVLRLFETECAQRAGDRAAAEKGFRALITRDASFIPAYVSLAGLLSETGRSAEAAELLARARALNADHWALQGSAP